LVPNRAKFGTEMLLLNFMGGFGWFRKKSGWFLVVADVFGWKNGSFHLLVCTFTLWQMRMQRLS